MKYNEQDVLGYYAADKAFDNDRFIRFKDASK